MRNQKNRQGFISALLRIPPEEIGETIFLENEYCREWEEGKRGILDVHILKKRYSGQYGDPDALYRILGSESYILSEQDVYRPAQKRTE